MERIKQAIEKVKGQREGGTQARYIYPQSDIRSQVQQSQDELVDINYEYTRVVNLQLEHLEKFRIVAFDKNDQKGMPFDLLRTHILQKMEDNGWRTLAITSPIPESGKTVVAINLAMSIAHQTNRSAMLVDFDLRRPKIGTYLGIPTEKSLNDLLDGTAKVSEILVNPGIPRLVVLPTGKPVANSSETLSSLKISDLVRDLRERYKTRTVIFDLPPVLATDDTLALLPHIDCVLMVVGNGMSSQKEIEDSLRHIPAEKLIGTVLNKGENEMTKYYY